jgi:hypothetical protein
MAALAALGILAFATGARAQNQEATLPDQEPPVSTSTLRQGEKIPAPIKEEPAAQVLADNDCGDGSGGFDWSKVPPIFPTPRTGCFFIAPSGPGYYSLRDLLEHNYREKAPFYPTVPPFLSPVFTPFFDADYRYLDNPDNTQFDFFDPIKRFHPTPNTMFTVGGEERLRYMDETNSRLTGKDNAYLLTRSRVFVDFWFRDIFRVYVEFLDARSTHQTEVPLLIDRDYADFLNLFGELKIVDFLDHPGYLRVGRQEMLFGSQRLISPLDWANTRRTFDGARAYWHGDKVDADVFITQPVIPNVDRLDAPDSSILFGGVWLTYRPAKGQFIDLYYLDINNDDNVAPGLFNKKGKQVKGTYNTSTLGSRIGGDYHNGLLWDFEGMWQFGDWSNQTTSAWAGTAGLGYNFANVLFTPSFWAYFDYASGDHNPGFGQHGTFNQLFPFGHFYFSQIDDFGRQNIQDLNFQANFRLTPWIFTNIQYHILHLDAAKDALYGPQGALAPQGGAIERIDPTGKAGTDVGQVLHVLTNFHLTQHQDIFIGYAHLFAGTYLKEAPVPGFKTVTPAQASDGELFYIQYSFRW